MKDSGFHPPVDHTALSELEAALGVALPREHRELLMETNGVEAYAGYARLYGVGTEDNIDIMTWNHPDAWKFPWADRCDNFICFGGTGWGDQYAYELQSLRRNKSPEVYCLEGWSMEANVVATSFDEFYAKVFMEVARHPEDALILQARDIVGPLEATSLVVFCPSLALGGPMNFKNVMKMHARMAMIANGDVAIQVDAAAPNSPVTGVQMYMDDKQRPRLKLVWR